MEAATNATTSETTETLASAVASINEDNEEGVSGGYNHSLHHFIQDELDTTDGRRSNSQIGGTVDQQDEEGRIMVNLEAIEVVSNLDEVSLVQGNFLSFGRRSNLNPFLSVLCSIILLYYWGTTQSLYRVWPLKKCQALVRVESIVSKRYEPVDSCHNPLVCPAMEKMNDLYSWYTKPKNMLIYESFYFKRTWPWYTKWIIFSLFHLASILVIFDIFVLRRDE